MFTARRHDGNPVCGLSVHADLCDAFHHAVRITYPDIVFGAAEDARSAKRLPVRRNTRVDDQTVVIRPDAQDISGGGEISPAAGTGHKGMSCPAKGAVVFACDELAVGVRFRLSYLYPVVLQIRTEGVVEFHSQVSPAPGAGRCPGPGIGMGEDGAVFL